MKSMKRAIRMQRTQRQIRKAKRVVARWGLASELDLWAKKYADHLKSCSCWGCVRRKNAGDTMQQRRQALSLKDEL